MRRMRAKPVVAVKVAWRWGRNSRQKLVENGRRFSDPTADNYLIQAETRDGLLPNRQRTTKETSLIQKRYVLLPI
jgi:hypothetical protein